MRVLTTFSGSTYDTITEPCIANALKYGADEVWVYDDAWLMRHPFRELRSNKWLWEHHYKRGMGWYAWKPLCIIDALERVKSDADSEDVWCDAIIAYCDGDTYPVADFSVLFDVAKRDGAMMFAASGHSQHRWCKRDAYIILNQDRPEYHNSPAGNARYMAFKAGDWAGKQFLWELANLLRPMRRPRRSTRPSLAPELEGFTESRSEQAIMTLLAHKYGYKLHRECCEGGEGWPEDRDMYGQIFSQVHQRNGAPPTGSKFAGRWDKTGRIGDL